MSWFRVWHALLAVERGTFFTIVVAAVVAKKSERQKGSFSIRPLDMAQWQHLELGRRIPMYIKPFFVQQNKGPCHCSLRDFL